MARVYWTSIPSEQFNCRRLAHLNDIDSSSPKYGISLLVLYWLSITFYYFFQNSLHIFCAALSNIMHIHMNMHNICYAILFFLMLCYFKCFLSYCLWLAYRNWFFCILIYIQRLYKKHLLILTIYEILGVFYKDHNYL